jgi:hypothetical protein
MLTRVIDNEGADEYLVILQNDLDVVRCLEPNSENRQDQSQKKKAAEDISHEHNELKMYSDLRAVGIVYIANHLLHRTPLAKQSAAPGNPSHDQEDLQNLFLS